MPVARQQEKKFSKRNTCRLTNQSTASSDASIRDALYYISRHILRQSTACEVIQKEQGLGVMRQYVVYAHRNQVDTDAAVRLARGRNLFIANLGNMICRYSYDVDRGESEFYCYKINLDLLKKRLKQWHLWERICHKLKKS